MSSPLRSPRSLVAGLGLLVSAAALVAPAAAAGPGGEYFWRDTATHTVKILVRGDRVIQRWVLPKESAPVLPELGEAFDNSLGMRMAWIPAGRYRRGSPEVEWGRARNETPAVDVQLEEGFWAGAYEVTQAQYEALLGSNPSRFLGDLRPVERVSWEQAREFCRRLTAREDRLGTLPAGLEYRLPSETEWEYAARAGARGAFLGAGPPPSTECEAPALERFGWYCGNSGTDDPDDHAMGRWGLKAGRPVYAGTHDVGLKHPNAWGLYDVLGNVSEWCLDGYRESYWEHPDDGSPYGDPRLATRRVHRGGAWISAAAACRLARRQDMASDLRVPYLGFRVFLAPRLFVEATEEEQAVADAVAAAKKQDGLAMAGAAAIFSANLRKKLDAVRARQGEGGGEVSGGASPAGGPPPVAPSASPGAAPTP